MNCKTIETSLIAYLDSKAPPAERREVQAHLDACSACRTRAEEFRALWGVLDELPQVAPSPAFDAAVRARVAQEPRAGMWAWLVPSPRMAFALAAMLVLSVWLTSMPEQRQASPNELAVAHGSEAEFTVIKNLPVLENYDVLSNFDALSEIPVQPEAAPAQPHM